MSQKNTAGTILVIASVLNLVGVCTHVTLWAGAASVLFVVAYIVKPVNLN